MSIASNLATGNPATGNPATGTLDHLVITTTDLTAARDECEARLGIRPEFGGTHPQFGTHNALLGLGGDAYVEFIALAPDAEVRDAYPFMLAEQTGTSACTFAAHPGDLDEAAARVAALGLDIGPIGPGARTTPDGTVLTWRLTRPLAAEASGIVPFLIEWQGGHSPAHSIAPQVRLTGWGASHPQPETIRAVLDTLGIPLAVVEGEPAFWVEFTGPNGTWRV